MTSLAITLVSGVLVFLGIFFSFDYWYDRIWGALKQVRDETLEVQRDLFINKSPEQVQRDLALVAGIAGGLVVFLTWPEVFFGLPMGIIVFWYAWKLPKLYYELLIRPARVQQFSVQMVDALTLMANGLKSGLNIPQTLQIVVDEMPDPIRQEFSLVLSENRVGKSLEEAFENLAKRLKSEDVSMFVTSVNILSETGGNVAETFQNIVKTIRERLKLQGKISAMTAQGMTSAVIVGALPWVMAAVLYFADPQSMGPMFTHPAGWVILFMVLVLELIGTFFILKIVKIKV